MDLRQRTRRFGAYILLFACILRISISGIPEAALAWIADPQNLPFLIYLETGRNVRFSASAEHFLPHFRESPDPWFPEPEIPVFSGEDAAMVEMDYDCRLRPDLAALLEKPLAWSLMSEEPAVLILHTHATESYTKTGEKYEETSQYRTLDEAYNMLSVGDMVAEILIEAGINVIHDRQLHDYPSYNGSYTLARKTIRQHLDRNPSIQLVLDLHRDALETNGQQLRTAAVVNGQPGAQLMFVVGTDASGQAHETWEENLALALKLHVLLERQTPGIMRPLNLRAQRFNQDLSPGALLVEVGAAGNSQKEALAAAAQLAGAIAAFSVGTAVQKPEQQVE